MDDCSIPEHIISRGAEYDELTRQNKDYNKKYDQFMKDETVIQFTRGK